MEVTSNVKGQLAISKAELRALELGFMPSRPLFDARYDLVIDDHQTMKRVQVKYADGKPSRSSGAVIVKLAYENRRKRVYTYQANEIDALIVYIPKIDRLCLFPHRVFVGKRNLCIRLEDSRNNQTKGIILARDYYW